MNRNLAVFPRNSNVQFRIKKVGMFSGPRPSYQQYSMSQNAYGAIRRTGA